MHNFLKDNNQNLIFIICLDKTTISFQEFVQFQLHCQVKLFILVLFCCVFFVLQKIQKISTIKCYIVR